MHSHRSVFRLLLPLFAVLPVSAQTLYVPSGTSGIGSSSNSNVGIGTATPDSGSKLEVYGGILTSAAFSGTVGGTGGIDYFSGSLRLFSMGTSGSTKGAYVFLAKGADGSSSTPMIIDSAGNVGIGTSPSYRWDVTNGSNGTQARFGSASTGYHSVYGNSYYLSAGADLSGGTWTARQTGGSVMGLNADGSLQLFYFTGATISNSVNLTEAFRIHSNGNIGIGTTSPSAKVEVVDTAGSLSIRAINSSINGASIGVKATDTGGREWALLANASGSGVAGTASIYDVAANVRAMTFTQAGNVGIGTNNPTQKLSVSGTIRAKEVVVDTGWSDYVFEKNYRLAPLSEVEAHIKAHGTLPGVPSEAQVAKEGVSVGEMQSKLLAKIEELTLHQIEQEKRLQKLETENAALRAGRP